MSTLNKKLESAKSFLFLILPHLRKLFEELHVEWIPRVETACVNRHGRIAIDPEFAEKLNIKQLAFVLAHEVYHVLYRVFDRIQEPKDKEIVNIAHDCMINEMLSEIFRANNEVEDWRPKSMLTYDIVLKNYLHIAGTDCFGSKEDVLHQRTQYLQYC